MNLPILTSMFLGRVKIKFVSRLPGRCYKHRDDARRLAPCLGTKGGSCPPWKESIGRDQNRCVGKGWRNQRKGNTMCAGWFDDLPEGRTPTIVQSEGFAWNHWKRKWRARETTVEEGRRSVSSHWTNRQVKRIPIPTTTRTHRGKAGNSFQRRGIPTMLPNPPLVTE